VVTLLEIGIRAFLMSVSSSRVSVNGSLVKINTFGPELSEPAYSVAEAVRGI